MAKPLKKGVQNVVLNAVKKTSTKASVNAVNKAKKYTSNTQNKNHTHRTKTRAQNYNKRKRTIKKTSTTNTKGNKTKVKYNITPVKKHVSNTKVKLTNCFSLTNTKITTGTCLLLNKKNSKKTGLIKKVKSFFTGATPIKTEKASSKLALGGRLLVCSSGSVTSNYLKKRAMNKDDISKDGYKAQGMEIIGNLELISAHKNTGVVYKLKKKVFDKKENTNSRLYVYDHTNHNFLGIVELNTKAHVGGLTYDSSNNLLFVTGKKNSKKYPELYTINFDTIKKSIEKGVPYYKVSDSDIVKGTEKITTGNITDKNMSSIEYKDNSLLCGTYDKEGKVVEIKYKYDPTKNELTNISTPKLVAEVGQGIQGMEYNNFTNTLITSTSCCITGTSRVYFTKMDTKENVRTTFIKGRGLQDIQVVNNDLYGIYEYGEQSVKELNSNIKHIYDSTNAAKATLKSNVILNASPTLYDVYNSVTKVE